MAKRPKHASLGPTARGVRAIKGGGPKGGGPKGASPVQDRPVEPPRGVPAVGPIAADADPRAASGVGAGVDGERFPTAASIEGTTLAAAAMSELASQMARRLAPGLYLVATPIGNLGDISLRALATLANASGVLCEDPRHSLRLLHHYGLRPKLGTYNDYATEATRAAIIDRIAAGEALALISDAGTPLISDPGYKLVRAVRAAGLTVSAVPGASALLAALTISGQPTDCVLFEGFLPAKSAARRRRLDALRDIPATLIIYEAPQRLAASLADMAERLGPRAATVLRELTKWHEDAITGELTELADRIRQAPARGEYVVVVEQGAREALDEGKIDDMLRTKLKHMGVAAAAAAVAGETGRSKNALYERALGLKDDQEQRDHHDEAADENG